MKFPGVPRHQREHSGEQGEEGPPVGVAQRARGSLRRQFPVTPDLRRAIDAPTMRDTLLPAVPGPQVADDTLVLRVLDLALRIGEVQLATGAGAAVAHDTMLSIARTYGLPTCDVDIAFSTITMCCHRGNEAGPVTTMRNVRYRTQDYTRLADVDDDHLHDRRPRGAADASRRRSPASAPPSTARTPTRGSSPAWRGRCSPARSRFLIGGGLLVAVLAALATGVIWTHGALAAQARGPDVLPADGRRGHRHAQRDDPGAGPGCSRTPPRSSSRPGIVVLLSGLSLVGLVQDAISGFPLTAAGRAVEVVLASAGLLVGVVVEHQARRHGARHRRGRLRGRGPAEPCAVACT